VSLTNDTKIKGRDASAELATWLVLRHLRAMQHSGAHTTLEQVNQRG